MLTKKLLLNLSSTILILAMVWAIFFVSKIALKEDGQDTNILSHLPNETAWFLKIDGKTIFQKSISSLFTKNHLNEISELLNDQKINDTEISSIGVDLQSGAVLFECVIDNEKYFGAIVNVRNKKNFQKNVINELSNKYGVRKIDNFAIIISATGRIKKTVDMNKIAQDLTFGLNPDLQKIDLTASDLNFKVRTQQLNGQLRTNINDSSISFDGNFNNSVKGGLFENDQLAPELALIPDGFHFSSRVITSEFNEFLNDKLGHAFPKIVGVSINHRYSELPGQSISNFAFDSDILIHFEEEVKAFQILEPFLALNHIETLDSTSFTHAGKKHFYQNVSSRTLYIGSSLFREELTIKQTAVVLVTGSPRHIVDVKGNGFARGILGLLSEFSATEELLNNIDSAEIKFTGNDSQTTDCKGTISFKDQHSSFLEMIKFLLAIKN